MTEDIVDILRDMRRWVKLIGIQEAKSVLDDALSAEDSKDQEELRIIYYLSDGEHSTRDIAEHVSVGKDAINTRQKSWAKMGLLEKEHSRAPYKNVISLDEAGMEIPEIPEPETEDSEESTVSNEEQSEGDPVEKPELTGEE